ncbi:MAG: SAM-dependent methyltransferase [Gammaproteobacteria bacterium]|nr:SAM-dependent methyltransferase [Gammaproteobacteria bacterium]
MRLFSIIQWHHFAYMMISLALLGYGVSGAFLMLLQRPLLQRFAASYIINLALFGITAVGCFLLAQHIPFNAEEVLWDPRQTVWLLCTYLLLAVPFFFAANAIGLALIHYRARLSRIYAADLLGAGLGSIGILALLFAVLPLQALTVLGLLGLSAALLATRELRQRSSAAWLLLPLAAALLLMPASWSTLEMSPYKGLSQTLLIKDTRIIAAHSSPLGQLSVVASPTIPLRHAPGLSLNATTEPPAQLGVFTDGDGMSVITRYNGDTQTLAHLDQLTSALPFHLQPVNRVLVLGAGGGTDVLQAHYHRAANIDAVELNPQFARLVTTDYADFAGHLYQQPGVTLHIAEARSFAAGSPGDYDLIQVSLLDSFSASASGQYALSENPLYTTEALAGFLQQLAADGFLSITRWIKLPPRDTLKLFVTAIAALRASGVTDPGQQLILIRGWQTSTLLVKNSTISPQEIDRVREFCTARSFDVAWYPGISRDESNRYNRLRSPWFHDAAEALLGDAPERFLDNYKFNLNPASDDQPYFFHFFKWRTLAEVLQLRERGGAALADAAYLILVATLVQAMFASLLLILLPIWVFQRRTNPAEQGVRRSMVMGYFFILGLAFLFIEIAFIQKLLLFLHHPLYAIAVVLSCFLVFSGLGSAWLGRTSASDRGRLLRLAVIAIVGLGTAYLLLLDPLLNHLAMLPDTLRILISVALIAPLAFCMGMPFPLGLGQLADHAPGLIPWAWAINGCASVISAVLATLLAIHLGFPTVIALALALYALTLWVFPTPWQQSVQGDR